MIGNVSTVIDSKVYKGKVPLEWPEYENALFYSIYGTFMNKADGIPPYVWSGRQNETEVHWGSLDNFPEGKTVNMKCDIIAYSKTSYQLFYRRYIFLGKAVQTFFFIKLKIHKQKTHLVGFFKNFYHFLIVC